MSSQFANNGLAGNFIENLRNQARRNAMRKDLETKGFIWIKTSGVPTSQKWNIDNWPTQSLENINRAYNEFGGIVADLHNRQKFYPENTASFVQIRQIVKDHSDDYIPNGSTNDDTGRSDSGSQQSSPTPQPTPQPQQAGYGSGLPDWAIATGIVAVGGTLFLLTIKK